MDIATFMMYVYYTFNAASLAISQLIDSSTLSKHYRAVTCMGFYIIGMQSTGVYMYADRTQI